MTVTSFTLGLRVGIYQPDLSQDHEYAVLDDRGVTAIATVWGGDEGAESYARLFAAAPELLEALKDLLGDRPSVQGGICQHCGRDFTGEMIDGECLSEDCPSSLARAAIAKAEGN
jgi:hypothetical protein